MVTVISLGGSIVAPEGVDVGFLKGFTNLISQETGVSAILAPNPIDCVALGAGKYFENTHGMENARNIYDSLNR